MGKYHRHSGVVVRRDTPSEEEEATLLINPEEDKKSVEYVSD